MTVQLFDLLFVGDLDKVEVAVSEADPVTDTDDELDTLIVTLLVMLTDGVLLAVLVLLADTVAVRDAERVLVGVGVGLLEATMKLHKTISVMFCEMVDSIPQLLVDEGTLPEKKRAA